MNAFLGRFPDVFRYARSELKGPRLALGAVGCFAAGLLLWLAARAEDNPGAMLLRYVFAAQSVLLLGYGTARTTGCVADERKEGTWDLQRLTPLTSFEVAAGKLLGAPVFAYALFAMLLPWTLLALALAKPLDLGVALRAYGGLAATAFMALSMGLLVSAYSAEAVGPSYSSTSGALTGFLAVQAFLPFAADLIEGSASARYFGLPARPSTLWAGSAGAIGLWAFLGAKWRVGQELLEGPRWWRLPGFLAFLALYGAGWRGEGFAFPIELALLAPALFVYMASVLNAEGADHWRRWLGERSWHLAPVWVSGCASFAALGAAALAFGPRSSGEEAACRLYPVLQAAFLARDLAFLQWVRLTGVRRPEVVAMACLAFAYVLPAIASGSVQAWSWRFLYVPAPNGEFGAAANLLPALAQAGLMGWLLARRLRPALRA